MQAQSPVLSAAVRQMAPRHRSPHTPIKDIRRLLLTRLFTNENFPGSSQTQVTGINNTVTAVGFYADSDGATTPNFIGFVGQAGVFHVRDGSRHSQPGTR